MYNEYCWWGLSCQLQKTIPAHLRIENRSTLFLHFHATEYSISEYIIPIVLLIHILFKPLHWISRVSIGFNKWRHQMLQENRHKVKQRMTKHWEKFYTDLINYYKYRCSNILFILFLFDSCINIDVKTRIDYRGVCPVWLVYILCMFMGAFR